MAITTFLSKCHTKKLVCWIFVHNTCTCICITGYIIMTPKKLANKFLCLAFPTSWDSSVFETFFYKCLPLAADLAFSFDNTRGVKDNSNKDMPKRGRNRIQAIAMMVRDSPSDRLTFIRVTPRPTSSLTIGSQSTKNTKK